MVHFGRSSFMRVASLSMAGKFWSSQSSLLRASQTLFLCARGQARCEAYALLHALTVWRKTLGSIQGELAVLGDALSVLSDLRLRARDPVLNARTQRLALSLPP